MKQFISIFTFLISVSVSSAQEVVGSYKNAYFGKNYNLEASLDDNRLDRVYIEIATKSSKSGCISIKANDLFSFKASLQVLRDKFLEWKKIATDNNVTDMTKDFDITFPRVTVAWYTSKWWFSFNQKITMKFTILDSGEMLALWTPEVTASSNEYIDERVYFTFSCEEDFNNLLNELDEQKICDKLLKTKKAEDLFQ